MRPSLASAGSPIKTLFYDPDTTPTLSEEDIDLTLFFCGFFVDLESGWDKAGKATRRGDH